MPKSLIFDAATPHITLISLTASAVVAVEPDVHRIPNEWYAYLLRQSAQRKARSRSCQLFLDGVLGVGKALLHD